MSQKMVSVPCDHKWDACGDRRHKSNQPIRHWCSVQVSIPQEVDDARWERRGVGPKSQAGKAYDAAVAKAHCGKKHVCKRCQEEG